MLARPRVVVALWLVVFVPCIVGLIHFKLDATSDSLVLDQDPDLRYYDETRLIFGTDSSLVVVIKPSEPLFALKTLEQIETLATKIDSVAGVASVLSVTRAPLFLNPPMGLFRLADGVRTIAGDDVDLELAQAEILANPLYAEALVSRDGTVTALQVELVTETELLELEQERYRLRDEQARGMLDTDGRSELRSVERRFRGDSQEAADRRRLLVEALRSILAESEDLGLLELGGLPMITVDIVRYIERDLVVFGIATVVFVLLMVALLFRSVAWTVAITANCCLTVLALLGILGWMDWRVTVVTSNLASLLFILTLAMSIHIAIRFKEEVRGTQSTGRDAMGQALGHVLTPCLFTVLTTMVGFGSLYLSKLRPVMDFASMMGVGLAIAFVSCFTLLPCLALVMRVGGKGETSIRSAAPASQSLYVRAGLWTLAHRPWMWAAGALAVVLGLLGMARLTVENSFVEYFKDSTPIHRGLSLIDQELGGTTPLEVVLSVDEVDGWFDPERLQRLGEFHAWLEQQPDIGYVASLASLVEILESIIASDPNPLLREVEINRFLLQTIRSRVPENLARSALRPFVSEDYSKTRLTARVKESLPGLDREDLLARIERRLVDHPVVISSAGPSSVEVESVSAAGRDGLEGVDGLKGGEGAETQRVTGMFVLYNNMLQSLFGSQVSTLLAVLAAIATMFWLLLRSVRLALIALVPNVLPVCVVLGTLGWAGVPLDMMTIMIAAITMGISVDDTVHYLYRLRKEGTMHDFGTAVARSHDTVGRAMVATTVAVSVGFSILVLSNFKPTVYFGLLTGLAMVTALLADGFLLPALIPAGQASTKGEVSPNG